MAEPFIGEIRVFSFDYAPRGWALCDGSTLSIQQNSALYSLLGTTYGGNGSTTFALPDLRGRTPVHVGEGVTLGQAGGEEGHSLKVEEMPLHTHQVSAATSGELNPSPVGRVWGQLANAFGNERDVNMHGTAMGVAGGGQPHTNMQPYLTLNFCIALVGIFPPKP